jgi:large subunit ribosomal protein L1
MIKISKRFKFCLTNIQNKKYSYNNAIDLLKKLKPVKFLESIEAHINLNINPKYSNQQFKSNLILPHIAKKKNKIAIYTNQILLQNYYNNNSDIIVGFTDLYNKISQNIINFNILLTTPDLIFQLAKLGKILGPKNLMPSLKTGTVTENIIQTVTEFQKGKIEYKTDKYGIIHLIIGKLNFSKKEIQDNLLTTYLSIEKNKPINFKGQLFKSFYICTSMSPSINIDLNSFKIIQN